MEIRYHVLDFIIRWRYFFLACITSFFLVLVNGTVLLSEYVQYCVKLELRVEGLERSNNFLQGQVAYLSSFHPPQNYTTPK